MFKPFIRQKGNEMKYTFEQAKAIVDAIANGQIFRVEFITPVRQVSGRTGKGYEVFKHTIMKCRKGVEYTHTKYIKQICDELEYEVGERANGTKDANNKGFADSKLGNKLLDLFSVDCKVDRFLYKENINRPKVEYIVRFNGTETVVTKKELEVMGIMQPAFFNDKTEEKYNRMVQLKEDWEKDKANYPKELKTELAKLIRDLYNKMFSVNVENLISIG